MSESTIEISELAGPLAKMVTAAVRRAVRSQAGVARSYVQTLRENHPERTPAQMRTHLDSRFLTLVTASGIAVGSTAAVPAVGTIATLGVVGAESVVFLEAAAFYTLAVAEVYGVDIASAEHEELLVMTIILGASGTALLSHTVGMNSGLMAGASTASRLSQIPGVREVNNQLTTKYVRRWAGKRVALTAGKLAPAGIGAVIGGWGNRKLGKTVVNTASATFGTPPVVWSAS